MEKDSKNTQPVLDEMREDIATEDYIIVYNKFSYGNRNKSYGLVVVVLDVKSEEIIKVDVALGSKNEIADLDLKLDSNSVIEILQEISQKGDYKNQKFRLGLQASLDRPQISRVIELIRSNEQDKVNRLFKEKLENIAREKIDLKLYTRLITKDQLQEIYPEVVPSNLDNLDEERNDRSSKKDEEENKLDLDIKLNCKPIISPVRGRKITNLNLGDKLPVKINDNREIGKELDKLLQDENTEGIAIGTIKEINFNEDSKRYKVLLKFKSNIYGSLVVDPELKITTFQIDKDEEDENENNPKLALDQNMLILFGVIILIVILSVIIITLYV